VIFQANLFFAVVSLALLLLFAGARTGWLNGFGDGDGGGDGD
jgi:hypothetical protein